MTIVQISPVRTKTEQRAASVVRTLRESPQDSFTYADLTALTTTPYDALLYMLNALCEAGLARKIEEPNGPGRPTVRYQWASALQEVLMESA